MSMRFPPIPRENLDDAQRAVFDAIASGPRGGVIGPFNFPDALVTGMSAGALVAGNTIVL